MLNLIKNSLKPVYLIFLFVKGKLNIDTNKNQKLFYYLKNAFWLSLPNAIYNLKLKKLISNTEVTQDVRDRVDYYLKINSSFELNKEAQSIKLFRKRSKKKTYYLDLIAYLRFYKDTLRFNAEFGDVTRVPPSPCLLKSRPIAGDNKNSILMKLNKVRHFNFVNDDVAFEDKTNQLVWRGKCHLSQPHRQFFIKNFYKKAYCNVGQTNTKNEIEAPWQKTRMKMTTQLKYKFVLAIEGNDVATNLKWIMSSNSIAMMVKPKYETWFMEGLLIPNHHYILLKDDYSDLEEKIIYYSNNIKESLNIINNANKYVEQFKNHPKEDFISLLVLQKYFKLSKQL